MKLSICMMVKNEEKNLPRCLEKLKPLTELGLAELIIIDTGSEDKSENIAKQYTDKVYFHKWNKNFSEMRNISMSYAKGEWIFIIDADERLDDVEKLITLMNSSEIKNCNTILLQVKNLYYVTDESKYNLITSPRLFKNDGKFRYEGAVHNQPMFNGPNLSVDISLTHFGYISNDKELMELKYKRTTELLKSELAKEPENLYYMYQLGVSYDMHGDYKEALDEFRKAYNILNKRSLEEKKIYVYIYASYSRIAYTNKEFKETIKVAKEALNFEKDYIDLYYLLGISEIQLRNNEEAFKYLNKYVNLAKRYNQLEISKDMSIIMYHIDDKSKSTAYFEMSKYYLDLEKYKDAHNIYNNITNINEKIYASINILIPLEKYSELRKVYKSMTIYKDRNNFLCTLEEKIKKIEDSQKSDSYNEFSLNEDVYGIFNKIRIANNAEEKISLTKLLIKEIDFNKEPIFYSEIFDNIKENIKLSIDIFKKIEIWKLKDIVKYLIEQKEFAEVFESYILKNNETVGEIEEIKVFIAIADILMLIYIKNNNNVSEKYLSIFKAYINMGIIFIQEIYKVDRAELIYKNISDTEDRFFMTMYIFNKLIKENNKKVAIKYMIEAVNTYEVFAKYIDVYKDEIFNLGENNIIQEEKKEFENYKLKVKQNINNLITEGNVEEAKKIINEYEEIVNKDIEIYSMKAVICIVENKLEDAEFILKSGLEIDDNNFDLTYNLAYLYEQAGEFNKAIEFYIRAQNYCNDYNVKQEIKGIIDKIKQEHPKLIIKHRKKIVFFVKQGMDSFLDNVIDGVSQEYETKKIIVTNYNQIDDGMEWADICWFEWCDELVIYGSKLPMAKEKKVICRLHSYEAFTDYPSTVEWDNINKLIVVAEHIKKIVDDKFKINNNKIIIIPNEIDVNKWTFAERKEGFNIAYVGYINYKKGPMLLLHTFKAIYDKDHRYKLYIAGQFQDDRDVLYFKQMIMEFGMEKNVVYEGWQDNLDEWLENKNYILCTSVLESQNMSVMQAMSKGIKPLVHNFVGAKTIYQKEYVWNTIDEAITMIQDNKYESNKYRNFVMENYSFGIQVTKINDLLKDEEYIKNNLFNKKSPLVTIGITNYNGKEYLQYCVESALRQTYSNTEILLIDDYSTDGSKEIIQQYEKKFNNIKAIYHKENSGGASKGIEEIIENANGKYFQWIACDDFLEEDAIQSFVSYLEKNPEKDYVYSDLNIINENNVRINKWEYIVLPKDKVVQYIFYTGMGIIPMNCLYRKNFFTENKVKWIIYKDNDFSADTLNTLHFIHHNFNYWKIDNAVINYRIHSNNASHNLGKRIRTSLALFDYIIVNFEEEIYFPQVSWNDIENRMQFKNYMIAKSYFEQFDNVLSRQAIPDYLNAKVTNEELIAYGQIFLEEGIKYINEALAQGNTYKIELNNLKFQYENYKK